MDINAINNINNNINVSKSKNTHNSENFADTLGNAMQNNNDKQIKKACQDFESYFVNMMFKSMRKTVSSMGNDEEKSRAEVIFQEMLDEEMAKNISKSSGVGLADMMYREIKSTMNYVI